MKFLKNAPLATPWPSRCAASKKTSENYCTDGQTCGAGCWFWVDFAPCAAECGIAFLWVSALVWDCVGIVWWAHLTPGNKDWASLAKLLMVGLHPIHCKRYFIKHKPIYVTFYRLLEMICLYRVTLPGWDDDYGAWCLVAVWQGILLDGWLDLRSVPLLWGWCALH